MKRKETSVLNWCCGNNTRAL